MMSMKITIIRLTVGRRGNTVPRIKTKIFQEMFIYIDTTQDLISIAKTPYCFIFVIPYIFHNILTVTIFKTKIPMLRPTR